MRAIITCDTCLNDDNLKLLLAELNLCPNRNIPREKLEKLGEVIKEKRDEISTEIPDDSKEIINTTIICTIYDGETKTWGIVSRPNKYRLNFRLKNPVSSKLKKACESLIKSLRSTKIREFLTKGDHVDSKTYVLKSVLKYIPFSGSIILPREYFKFYPLIEILEKNSEEHSFSGTIVHRSAFKAAIGERTIEYYIVMVSGFIAIMLLYLTSPISLIRFNLEDDWDKWLVGTMSRMSTAALLTMIISGLELFLHWMSIRRESSIQWNA